MSHLTQNRSLWRCSYQPISKLSSEETKPNRTKTNNTETKRQKHSKSKPKSKENANLNQQSTLIKELLTRACISLCTTVIHNTAVNSSDNLHSSTTTSHEHIHKFHSPFPGDPSQPLLPSGSWGVIWQNFWVGKCPSWFQLAKSLNVRHSFFIHKVTLEGMDVVPFTSALQSHIITITGSGTVMPLSHMEALHVFGQL